MTTHFPQGARIGVWTLSPEESAAVDDQTEAVFAAAVKQLEAAGATPVPVQLPHLAEVGAGETPALLAKWYRGSGEEQVTHRRRVAAAMRRRHD